MENKVYVNSIKLIGENCPSWESISGDVWQTILIKYFFKISDSFGFMEVLERRDLFPEGLDFFNNWELEEVGPVELEDDIVCKFNLNDNCKMKLLEFDFSVHQFESAKFNNYYEFDELYFFSANRLRGVYINHENMVVFISPTLEEATLLNNLDKSITKDIIYTTEFWNAFNKKHYR